MTAWDVDRAVERVARGQHGAFSDRQARSAGATSRMIRRRLAAGRWTELDHHVYALPSHPCTWHRHCMAATLALDQAALSHSSAATLHRLTGFRPGRVHIVVPPTSSHSTRLATVHRSAWPQLTVLEGIRTTTLADTLFQLAGTADQRSLRIAGADAIVAHTDLLPRLFDRYVELAFRRLPGIATMRALLDEHDDCAAPPASELERLLDHLLDRVEDLPARQRQAPLPGWDRGEARVDVLIDDWRLIVEADGRRWHTRVTDFERDRWRDNVATMHGYDVLRFTHHQLTTGRDEVLVLLDRYAAARQTKAPDGTRSDQRRLATSGPGATVSVVRHPGTSGDRVLRT